MKITNVYHIKFQYHFQNNFYKNSYNSSVSDNTINEIQWRTELLTQLQIMACCWEAANPLPKFINIVIFIKKFLKPEKTVIKID